MFTFRRHSLESHSFVEMKTDRIKERWFGGVTAKRRLKKPKTPRTKMEEALKYTLLSLEENSPMVMARDGDDDGLDVGASE